MKTKTVNIHVVPVMRGLLWDIKVDSRRIGGAATQATAEANAIFLAKKMFAASVRTHYGNGRFKWERSYGEAESPKKG